MRFLNGAYCSLATTGRAALFAAILSSGGCATIRNTIGAYDTGHLGIALPQQRLRDALMREDFPAVFDGREDDALLRALNVGASAFYAGQYSRSAAVLDSAALLADDRITASLSRDGLALLTNDLARPYQPRRTERLFIPYYGMLALARLEQWEGAAVEARRLSSLLAQYAPDRTEDERATHATLHYLAGAVFERAGEASAARVAYSNATALLTVVGTRGPRGVPALHAGEGEVLVVIERGFVAHRATESVNIAFGDDGDWLAVAFPALRRAPRIRGVPSIAIGGSPMAAHVVIALLDDASAADERRERVSMLTRAALRAAAKCALTKVVKDKKGEVAGRIASIGASLLERADIRSWHVLPQQLTVLRVRAPRGVHTMALRMVSEDDGPDVVIGPVIVRAGEISITTLRLWREGQPALFAKR